MQERVTSKGQQIKRSTATTTTKLTGAEKMIVFYNTKMKAYRDRKVLEQALLRIIPHNTMPHYPDGDVCVYPVSGMTIAQGQGEDTFVWDVDGQEIGRSVKGITTFTPLFMELAVKNLYKVFGECK